MKLTVAFQGALLSFLAAVVFTGIPSAIAQQQSFENENEQELRREAFLSIHRDPTGKPRPDLWREGIAQFLRVRVSQFWRLPAPSQWTQIGPQPLRIDDCLHGGTNDCKEYQGTGPDSGEVVDVAIDPTGTTDQTVYIATNDGGIWKTTDGGNTWKAMTDTGCPDNSTLCPSLSMGAVALNPLNPQIVFAGTGNPFDGGGLFTKGVGLYRSMDGGNTWTVLNPGNIFTNVAINRIVVGVHFPKAPTPFAMLVATSAGLFKSIDNGNHFGNNSPKFDNGQPVLADYISDLKVDTLFRPQAVAAVYAAASGKGVFRSSDGGTTFPTNLFDNPGAPVAGTYCFVSIAQSTKPNNQRLYASVEALHADGSCGGARAAMPFLGLYRSDDAGATWAKEDGADGAGNGGLDMNGNCNGPVNNNCPCQCGYDQTVGVDPQDEDRVYIGFQELYLSTDGGVTFSNITNPVTRALVHWDHHAICFSPPSHQGPPPTRLWVGEDGGIASSGDGGTTWNNLNETLATNLFKHIDIGKFNLANIPFTYGGTQDTGTIEHRPDFMGNDWHLAIDGDGSGVGVDPGTATTAFGADNGYYINTTNGGNTWGIFTPPPTIWRYAIDPNNGANIFAINSTDSGFYPGFDLYRSTDGGVTFNNIQTFATRIRSIANTVLNPKLIWLGLYDGSLQRCDNALNTPPGCTAIGNPSGIKNPVGGISIILTDPNTPDKDRVIVVYEGFSNAANPSKHVWYSENSGAKWDDISNTLPDLPTHSVVGSAVISNDAGVMSTNDLGSNWQVLGTGVPTVDSTQLAVSSCPPMLRLGTYGRSVFELNPSNESGVYDNGPVDGETGGWPISGGYWVSDSFRATGSNMGGMTFAVWLLPTEMPVYVVWLISDQPNGGNVCGFGQAKLNILGSFLNSSGYEVYTVDFDIPPLPLTVGATYFVTLQGLTFSGTGGGLAYWDQNNGVNCAGSGTDLNGNGANCPSYAYAKDMGSIPSETFTITTTPPTGSNRSSSD